MQLTSDAETTRTCLFPEMTCAGFYIMVHCLPRYLDTVKKNQPGLYVRTKQLLLHAWMQRKGGAEITRAYPFPEAMCVGIYIMVHVYLDISIL